MTPRRTVTETDSESSPRSAFRTDIQGLRAVAVLSVVAFHAGVPGIGGGFVGVDVFFVISGFLITGMLWREASDSGTVRLGRFYGARARRLLPASALVGVVTMIATVLFLSPLQVKMFSVDAITSALYVSNIWFLSIGINYFTKDNLLTPSPFQHYWSLGVEEQFYFVWPVVIIVTAWTVRRGWRRSNQRQAPISVRPFFVVLTLVAVLSFALSAVATYVLPPLAYFSLPTRAWQLAAGGLVALSAHWWHRLPSMPAAIVGWLGLALVAVACVGLSSTTPYPGLAALLPTIGAVLVIGAGCDRSSPGCDRFLGLPPMQAIGRVSYSWYLWHWPILVFAPVLLGHPLGLPGAAIAVLFSFGLAELTMRLVENPLRFANPIRRSTRNSLVLGAAVTAAAVVVGVVPMVTIQYPVGHGPALQPLVITAKPVPPGSDMAAYDDEVRRVFAQVQSAVAAGLELTSIPANLTPPLDLQADQMEALWTNGCHVIALRSVQPECVVGDRNSATTVALIGDSHASMFNPAFHKLADERGWRLGMFSKASCPIVDLPLRAHFAALTEKIERCRQWREQILSRVRAERPKLVVLSSAAYGNDGISSWGKPGFDFYNPAWVSGLADLVRELRNNGSQVLVLGQTPKAPSSPPICLSGHLDDPTACEIKWRTTNEPGKQAEVAAIEAAGGQFADLTELFCLDGRCPVIVGNNIVFFDAEHLTWEYSQSLAPAIGALVDRALARS